LTAVGKDVSFVVQPLDFIELLKKALKSATFSWKDYLVSWISLAITTAAPVAVLCNQLVYFVQCFFLLNYNQKSFSV